MSRPSPTGREHGRCDERTDPTPTGRVHEGDRRTERQTGSMPIQSDVQVGGLALHPGRGGWRCSALVLVEPVTSVDVLPTPRAARSATSAWRATAASSLRPFAPICASTSATPTTPAKVDQSIKALFATGLFADVRIDRDGAGVLVTVRREPGHQPGRLRGQQRGRQGHAAERGAAQAALGVHARPRAGRRAAHPRRLPPPGPLRGVGRAQDHRARQQPREPRVRDQRGRRRPRSRPSTSSATRPSPTSQLRDIITTTQSGLFDFLKGTNIYDPDRLALDRELLRQYYLKNGYADARVVSAGAELDRDGSGFFITFVVDEGELFKFGDDRHRVRAADARSAAPARRAADRSRRRPTTCRRSTRRSRS